jgi:hypothetical protein
MLPLLHRSKSVFQVYGVDAAGQVVVRRRLKRRHVLAFFHKLRRAWSAPRLALHPTTDRANCRHLAIRFA